MEGWYSGPTLERSRPHLVSHAVFLFLGLSVLVDQLAQKDAPRHRRVGELSSQNGLLSK
jgi:hypothetical protein